MSSPANTTETNWPEWFTRDGETVGVPETCGSDGRIRLATGPAGRGIILARSDRPALTFETPPGVVTRPLAAPAGQIVWFHDDNGDDTGVGCTAPLTAAYLTGYRYQPATSLAELPPQPASLSASEAPSASTCSLCPIQAILPRSFTTVALTHECD